MNDRTTSAFAFPPFHLDPVHRLLRRDGQSIPLTPKEFDTLLVLVEAGGRLVEKEELIARVWPDSFVGDGSLARNISVLRKLLGEEVIQTHRGRGYLITLPVVGIQSSATGSAVESPQTAYYQLPSPPSTAMGLGSKPQKWRRTIVVGLGVAASLFVWFGVSRFLSTINPKAHASTTSIHPVHSVLIQKDGAIDPLDEGFRLTRPDGHYAHALYNRETNGWDRWRITTDDQNMYYRSLGAEEKDFALRGDWRLTCVCALERGAGFSDIDFSGKGHRFDIAYLQEGNRYFVALTKQISPRLEWEQKLEFPGVGDVDHPHTYELRYDHVSGTASLWIDGQMKASGYRGHAQFQDDLGLMFGAAIYMGVNQSSMVFRTVRFEAK